jgi:hypothetical protein
MSNKKRISTPDNDWVPGFKKSDVVHIIDNVRGHIVMWDISQEQYLFHDTLEPVTEPSHKINRPCTKCGKPPTEDGHDACLAKLPGVRAACCGHGITRKYILYKNGVCHQWDKDGTPLREIVVSQEKVFGKSVILVKEHGALQDEPCGE